MKLHPGKIVAIVVMIWIYGMGILAINLTDSQQATRHQLTRFYETEMDSCIIKRIDTLDADNRGGYRVFYTDCNNDFYPIFLEDHDKKDLFKVRSIISKKSNSLDISIVDDNKKYDFKIRHPNSQDDRGFGTLIVLGFISVATILILLTPNSKFQKLVDK